MHNANTEPKVMYLKCIRCGKPYQYNIKTFRQLSYRKYSYCDDCIDRFVDIVLNMERRGIKFGTSTGKEDN